MLTRQEVLLLVGAMHFVVDRAAITKKVSPNMHIIKNFDVGGTIHQFACTDFWSLYLVQIGAEIR